jgi:hypothetical protein
MRRIASALALGMLVASLVAAPALAKAEKVDLVPITGLAGGGAVVFNNSAGPNNLEVTVQLKKVAPDFTFDVYVFIDGAWLGGAPVGSVTTNGAGNATFHVNGQVPAGDHFVAVDVALPVSGADQYLAPAFTSPQSTWGIVMTFK